MSEDSGAEGSGTAESGTDTGDAGIGPISTEPAMTDAAGRDEAADGLGDLEPSFAEGAAEGAGNTSDDESRPSLGDVPAVAAGAGSGDADRTGDAAAGTATGGDLSRPLG